MERRIEVIPRKRGRETKKTRAAVYCRVSTKDERQEDSLENQMSHYRREIGADGRHELAGVYHDFGISGYKESRPGFARMLEDARKGRFDIIITKSITRFARNTKTVVETTRMLKELGIGVFFELQEINTLSQEGELMMTLYAAFGQAESEGARMHTIMARRREYEEGRPIRMMHRSLGYTKNGEGEIVPDGEAPTVIEMFEMCADGFSAAEIANYLNGIGKKTKNGCRFDRTGVTRILRNEVYKGDFVCRKHYVNEDRKLVKNRGEEQTYYIEGDHIPIVTKALWDKAQSSLDRATRKATPTKSRPRELTDENYPYRHSLFCARCGHKLIRAVRAGRVLWECEGKTRFSKEFCGGVQLTDDEVLAMLPFGGDAYFFEKKDRGKVTGHGWLSKEEWGRTHTKKRRTAAAPELNEENYPYMNRIFCKYCGNRLRRIIGNNGRVTWICEAMSRRGKGFCKGVRIPDEKLEPLRHNPRIVYIGKENVNGRESYGYSAKPDEEKAWR